MGILTPDMKRVVGEQRLGFFATVCEDGSPNLSPKGTTYVLDDDHLLFAEIRSPQTVANIRRGSAVEVNVVDPFVRKGYRFKGRRRSANPEPRCTPRRWTCCVRPDQPSSTASRAVVVIEVREARRLVSPAYDDGITTETDVIATHRARFARLHGDR